MREEGLCRSKAAKTPGDGGGGAARLARAVNTVIGVCVCRQPPIRGVLRPGVIGDLERGSLQLSRSLDEGICPSAAPEGASYRS